MILLMELCDSCGKNEATVHLTEIVKDEEGQEKKSETHLCEECAQKQGVGPQFTPQSFLGQLVGYAAEQELTGAVFSDHVQGEVPACPLLGL